MGAFEYRRRLMEEVEGAPLDPWNNDLDAFLVSFEDLNAGGHGLWYGSSVEESYTDELTDAYREVDRMLNIEECTRTDGTESPDTRDTDNSGTDDGEGRDRAPAGEL